MKCLKQMLIYLTMLFMCILSKLFDIPRWIIDHSWVVYIALLISYGLYCLFDNLDGKR